MKIVRAAAALGLLVLPLALFAQKKETLQLQRDVAILSDNVRTLQSSLDQKVAALTVLIQQALDNIAKSNTSITGLETSTREQIKTQLMQPLAGVSSRMDQINTEVQALRGSVDDLNERLKKMDAKIADLKALVEVTRAPATAPPPGSAPAAGAPTVSAQETYANALRDKSSGNLDLALNEFGEFLKHFGDSELAPNAQFQMGDILYQKADYDNALKAFDLVLEKFPENNKTPDAMYMKGMTLLRMNQRTAAGKEFQELVKRYPSAEVSGKARDQLKALGLRSAAPAPAAKPAKKARKRR